MIINTRKVMISINYESFENLDESKKQRIINAGFSVFAEYGYAKASVDDIVKLAGISKGSLFYYFKSKENFFHYLYDYCIKVIKQAVNDPGPDGKPSYLQHTDFFERLNAVFALKMKANLEYPQMANFIRKIIFDSSSEARDALNNLITKYTEESVNLFLTGIDFSKFKNGIDPRMVMQLLIWCSEGCVNQIQIQNKDVALSKPEADFDKVIELYYSYVDLFRKNFYKEEYLQD